MLRAESLHREVAFLSNELHRFSDDDIVGVKPIIEQIIEKRNTWTEVRGTIAYFDKMGRLPQEKAQNKPLDASESELKLQLIDTQSSLRKQRWNIKNKGTSLKMPDWEAKLAMLEAQEKSIQEALIERKYATT